MSENNGPKTPMTPDAASRIQSHADRTGTNQGFKGRAQSAGTRYADGRNSGGAVNRGKRGKK